MKCPKCGFVSYAGLDQCKKCAYPFVKAAPKVTAGSITTLFPEGVRPASNSITEASLRSTSEKPSTPNRSTKEISRPATAPEPEFAPQQELPVLVPTRAEEPLHWRDELSKRVGNYRKRRARMRVEEQAPAENLELEFEPSQELEEPAFHPTARYQATKEPEFEMDLGESETQVEEPLNGDGYSLDESSDVAMQLDAPSADEEEISLGEPAGKSDPMEILVGAPTEDFFEEEHGAPGIYLAPLRRRFMAGVSDALVLLAGAGVFALIFWRFCGSMSLVPLNLIVLGMLAVILIFSYFAVFTAIASATPGLLWMGCEIRNMRGEHPTISESSWRAFGVLVSLSALMLGFIWACVDSDGLTWHDRMSGTVITEEHSVNELASAPAETT